MVKEEYITDRIYLSQLNLLNAKERVSSIANSLTKKIITAVSRNVSDDTTDDDIKRIIRNTLTKEVTFKLWKASTPEALHNTTSLTKLIAKEFSGAVQEKSLDYNEKIFHTQIFAVYCTLNHGLGTSQTMLEIHASIVSQDEIYVFAFNGAHKNTLL